MCRALLLYLSSQVPWDRDYNIAILEMRLGKKGPVAIQLGSDEAGIRTRIQAFSTNSFIYSFDTF